MITNNQYEAWAPRSEFPQIILFKMIPKIPSEICFIMIIGLDQKEKRNIN